MDGPLAGRQGTRDTPKFYSTAFGLCERLEGHVEFSLPDNL